MELEDIKGLGAKRAEKLRASGISDPLDLLLLFPRAYFDKRARIDWRSLSDKSRIIFKAAPISPPVCRRIRRGLSIVRAEFMSFGERVVCNWFNQTYVLRRLSEGGEIIIEGRVKRHSDFTEIAGPRIITDREGDIVPVYDLPDGLNRKLMYDAASAVLSSVHIESYVGKDVAKKFGLTPLASALKEIHFPSSVTAAESAIRSVATENLAYTLGIYKLLKSGTDKKAKAYPDNRAALADAAAALPFRLTADQHRAVTEILRRMMSDERMNVLLQGDVGSGKTIVAFLAAYYVALGGYQCAIMAPTEILARQHYEKAKKFFGVRGINVVCLTGSTPVKERAVALDLIESGEAAIAVGTHALTGKNVRFHKLGLTITDEQHRFGVCQRGSLENKADGADNIVMSATPIPRTLSLALYGRLETIDLRTKPVRSDGVTTSLVPLARADDMFAYMAKKAENGEKSYVVCPRIDGDDEISALAMFERLKRLRLNGTRVALLHGRMSGAEKDSVMSAFANGDVSVLVCTTVVEVGIDVPSATTMAIFGADRLGLSQLHQLRGRIGRRGQKSYCFIVTDEPSDRLKFLCGCSDGFALAEYDFDTRGAGDFLGTRQHGKEETFAGVKIDAAMLKKAGALADELLSDPDTAAALATHADGREEFIRSLSLN